MSTSYSSPFERRSLLQLILSRAAADRPCRCCHRTPSQRLYEHAQCDAAGVPCVSCPGCGAKLRTPERPPGLLARIDRLTRPVVKLGGPLPLHRLTYRGSGSAFSPRGRKKVTQVF